jgi:hypothetical protein
MSFLEDQIVSRREQLQMEMDAIERELDELRRAESAIRRVPEVHEPMQTRSEISVQSERTARRPEARHEPEPLPTANNDPFGALNRPAETENPLANGSGCPGR